MRELTGHRIGVTIITDGKDKLPENTKTGIIPGSDGKDVLFIKIEQAIFKDLIEKPYPEQLKTLLKLVQGVKTAEGTSGELLRRAQTSEKALKSELNMVYAELN
jgi:hypothetical protein